MSADGEPAKAWRNVPADILAAVRTDLTAEPAKSLDAVLAEHRPIQPHHCWCGWQGDFYPVHIIDAVQVAGFDVVRATLSGRPP